MKTKHIVDNNLKAYGETDAEKKVVKINKVRHKQRVVTPTPQKDQTLINTIVHEELHVKHPQMTEAQVRKKARAAVMKGSNKQKQKFYNLYKK